MVDGDCRFLDIDVSYIVLFPILNFLLENHHYIAKLYYNWNGFGSELLKS